MFVCFQEYAPRYWILFLSWSFWLKVHSIVSKKKKTGTVSRKWYGEVANNLYNIPGTIKSFLSGWNSEYRHLTIYIIPAKECWAMLSSSWFSLKYRLKLVHLTTKFTLQIENLYRVLNSWGCCHSLLLLIFILPMTLVFLRASVQFIIYSLL